MRQRLARLLSSRASIAIAVLLAIVLLLPALRVGFMMDDYSQPSFLRGGMWPTGGPRGVWDMFRFQDADRVSFRSSLDEGYFPWWSNPELRLAFLRPLTSLTHAFDHRFFPGNAPLMRFESLLVYGAVVAMAGLLYRRLQGATVAFGLAALMFALDDAHSLTVVWIANRNAVLAAAFGFGALVLHDRAVRDTDRRARIAAPILFAVAMLAGEAALATLGYLVAHALWLQPESYKRRLRTLAPYFGVAALWAIVYRAGGYGASGSEMYIDPGTEPGRFFGAYVRRLPVLLEAQLSVPPAELWTVDLPARGAVLAISGALLAIIIVALAFGLRRTKENAFYATGMLLALVPVCATMPSDRLLLFSGLGAFGLAGDLLTAPRDHLTQGRRVLVRAVAGLFIVLHIVLAPLLYAGRGYQIAHMLNGLTEHAGAHLPPQSELAGKTLVVVNAPDFLSVQFAIVARMERGEPRLGRYRALANADRGTMVLRRTGERTVEVVLSEGFFNNFLSNAVRRDERPEIGDTYRVTGMTATVKAFTADRKRAGTIELAFDEPIDGPGFVWVVWGKAGIERMNLPAVGQEVELPTLDYPKALKGAGITKGDFI